MAHHQVGPGTVVHFGYELFDEEDALVEASEEGIPLAFLCGFGQLSSSIEAALDGARQGDTRSLTLTPDQGFGDRDADAILELDASEFPAGTQPGDEFDAEDEDGGSVCMRIVDVEGERVWVDTNHPLAGQTIRMQLHVQNVRPATSAEIAQAEEALANREEDDNDESLLPIERLLRRQ